MKPGGITKAQACTQEPPSCCAEPRPLFEQVNQIMRWSNIFPFSYCRKHIRWFRAWGEHERQHYFLTMTGREALKSFGIHIEWLIICAFMLHWVGTMTHVHCLSSYERCWTMCFEIAVFISDSLFSVLKIANSFFSPGLSLSFKMWFKYIPRLNNALPI